MLDSDGRVGLGWHGHCFTSLFFGMRPWAVLRFG
jgi:hypothetical protein